MSIMIIIHELLLTECYYILLKVKSLLLYFHKPINVQDEMNALCQCFEPTMLHSH